LLGHDTKKGEAPARDAEVGSSAELARGLIF
jgi:hypothetical protein